MALSMGKQMTLPATISSPFHSVNCCKEMKILYIKNNLVSMQRGIGLESGCRGESVMRLPTALAFQAAGSLSLEPPLLPPGLINNSNVIKTVSFRQCSKPKR